MYRRLFSYYQKVRAVHRVKSKLLFTILNSIALVLFTIWLQYVTVTRVDELVFYKWFALLRHNVLSLDNKPLKDSLLFLDVSKDLALVNDTFPEYGKQVITDRKTLTHFFNELKNCQGGYRFILCDIGFDYLSDDDAALNSAMKGIPRIILAKSSQSVSMNNVFPDVPAGGVSYSLSGSSFVKFQVFYTDGSKSLPAILVEQLGHKRYTRNNGLVYENGRPAFNAFTPELYYRSGDLIPSSEKGGANLFHLGEIIQDSTMFHRTVENKYIVVGNFYTDMHNTYLGAVPGSLLLINSFLTLRDYSIAISFTWILCLWGLFLVMSYFIFIHPEKNLTHMQKKIKPKFLQGFIKTYLSYAGILIVVNFLSYLFFGIIFSLFYVATWLAVLETVIEKRRILKEKKNLFHFVKEELV